MEKVDERLGAFTTLRDWFRHAVSRFNEAGLAFGHGCDNAVDEAAFVVLEALHLPIDALDPFLDAKLMAPERRRLAALIDARVQTRKPASYLLGRAYVQGVKFLVDERVIVPRSYIGELLFHGLVGDGRLIEDPLQVGSVLDLCTGGGSLAILAAQVFERATVDAVELSPDALDVAKANVAEHRLQARVDLRLGDLFGPVAGRRFDLILANPPYVTTEAIENFPPEFAAEPRMAHEAGVDGLAVVRRILADAKRHLTREGLLVCEVGHGRARVDHAYPDLPLLWLDTQTSAGEVFALAARDLAKPRAPKPAGGKKR